MTRQAGNPRRIGTYKVYPDPLERIELPPPEQEGGRPLWKVLTERRSIREYDQESLSLGQVSQLLWASQGITRERGEWQFRTAPSAGALYPIETYLAVNRVGDLEGGLYHYEVRYHRLAFVREDPLIGTAMARAALGQNMCQRAALLFIWTAVVSRSARKYGERAFRYIYMDAGHIGQNLYLAATSLDLACCAIGAFFDDEVNQLLEIDGREETTVYMASVGPKAL
ncbi:MAG: SagB/ThcOx family dehydrogenase [Chloroflexia bacterium]|nr:SagB/ThcOx family dehydrogenase [Chloroflexia bacterium]